MADIIVNGQNLGTSPVINLEDEFFRTADGEIIGGVQKISINGSVVGIDGTTVMGLLKSIRELGSNATCINITTDLYNGLAKVENVTISQGPDPTWINQGEFSIELTAPMTTIPANRFNFVAGDNVREFSQSESLSLGDESHGYVFSLEKKEGGEPIQLSKTFVRWSTKMSIRCEPFCSSTGTDGIDLLKKLLYAGPTNSLGGYNSTDWTKYLGSRNLDINSDGSISFSASVILVNNKACEPKPNSTLVSAFVDISFATSDTYSTPKSETHTISGNIQGLSSISWTDLITLSDVCSSTKLTNAITTFNLLSPILKEYEKAFLPNYLPLTLMLQPNCPTLSTVTTQACANTVAADILGLLRPQSSSVSVNRITGDINFSISWSSANVGDNCVGSDGATENLSINITPAIQQFAQQAIPRFGTTMQKLGAYKNEKINFTYTKNGAQAFGLCPPPPAPPGCTDAGTSFNDSIKKWMDENAKTKTYLCIAWTKTSTNTSYTENQDFIEICPTYT